MNISFLKKKFINKQWLGEIFLFIYFFTVETVPKNKKKGELKDVTGKSASIEISGTGSDDRVST